MNRLIEWLYWFFFRRGFLGLKKYIEFLMFIPIYLIARILVYFFSLRLSIAALLAFIVVSFFIFYFREKLPSSWFVDKSDDHQEKY